MHWPFLPDPEWPFSPDANRTYGTCHVKGIGDSFCRDPMLERENITPLNPPAAVIHKSGAMIAVFGDIPEHLLSQIISDDQFERVQQIIAKGREDREKLAASGSKAFARRKSNDIWVNKMQCECGKNFNRKGMSKTEDGQTECIYMCHGQVCTGTAAARAKKGLGTESICKVPIIPSWKLQMMVYEVFHACLQDVDTVLELANLPYHPQRPGDTRRACLAQNRGGTVKSLIHVPAGRFGV